MKLAYLESTVRDAHAAGLIHAPDAKVKAETLFAFFQGALTQARIQNNVEILRHNYEAALDILGASRPAGATATVP
ncbi:MAG: hypothetical protein QM796_03460 [Chthoniobacteraceae bacterium]